MRTLVGVDIQPIGEVEESLREFGDRYRGLIFTDQELDSCGNHPATTANLAERFAAKEAVLKILEARESPPPWRSIEVKGGSGQPQIVLHGLAADLAHRQGLLDMSVSLSHAGGIATAVVVASVVPERLEQRS
ncbi:MAG: 4'-phosphopantetheinyl transferase superfamily protein [Acidimicrobiales bacterium]|jgi:phosphopantetheine--protein transferase-like protein